MPKTTEDQLQKFLSLMDRETLSKEDFVSSFQKVIDFVLKIQARQEQAIQELRAEHERLMGEVKTTSESNYSELKGQVDEVFVGNKIKEISSSLEGKSEELKRLVSKVVTQKLKEVDVRARSLKDGERGPQGERGPEGLPPSKETILKVLSPSMEEFKKEWADKVQEVLRSRPMVGGSANAVNAEDVSSQITGSTRAFVVPRHRKALLVVSTQAPFVYRPTVDFTTANRTLTISSALDFPQAGQTLIFMYVK